MNAELTVELIRTLIWSVTSRSCRPVCRRRQPSTHSPNHHQHWFIFLFSSRGEHKRSQILLELILFDFWCAQLCQFWIKRCSNIYGTSKAKRKKGKSKSHFAPEDLAQWLSEETHDQAVVSLNPSAKMKSFNVDLLNKNLDRTKLNEVGVEDCLFT